MRASIYVDGFNLYFLRLRAQRWARWLDLHALASEILNPRYQIQAVNFYTARVSGRLDREAPAKQQVYLNTLATVPQMHVHFCRFLFSEKWAHLVKPPSSRPSGYPWPKPAPDLVWVSKTEEKGSDVNLGAHLVRDALMDRFDAAFVITNDTDLVEPIRIARQEAGKTVGLISPLPSHVPTDKHTGRKPKAAASLQRVASFTLHIHNRHLRAAQFADQLVSDGKEIHRPNDWR